MGHIQFIGVDHGGDTDSFHPSIWDEERERRQQIHFEFNEDMNDQVKWRAFHGNLSVIKIVLD